MTHLPNTDDGVSDQDKQNDEGFYESCDHVIVFLKQGEDLQNSELIALLLECVLLKLQ